MECPLCCMDINRDDVFIIPHVNGAWEVMFHCYCGDHMFIIAGDAWVHI